ncbi:MAG: hypothetical protein ACREBE_29600, partial [bacterium]
MSRRIRLGESLVESGLITPAQLDEALRRGASTGERIGEALVGLGFISERDLLRTLAQDADIPFLEPRELVVDPMVVSLVSGPVAKSQHVVPLRYEAKALLVAMGNPFDVGVIRSLERSTGKHIRVAAADPAEIAQLVETIYGGSAAPAGFATGAPGPESTNRARSTWTANAGAPSRAGTP